jgi:VanZ family protein
MLIVGAQYSAWILAIAITVLSVVPPGLRPETEAPHAFEHFAIFFATGIAFGIGYGGRPLLISVAVFLFAASIEVIQMFIPNRHARLSDFAVDGVAIVTGAILAALLRRTLWA